MSFLFPRTISINRPSPASVAGAQEYGDLTPDQEDVIHTDLIASIQHKATAGATGAGLPGDTRALTTWRIFIPLSALPSIAAPPAIMSRDIIIDDFGLRYQVTAAYPNSLGWSCLCDLLEV
ncbi:MAG: hypothetical protein K2Y56_24015 [Methylobacterium sp.]|uniref:hypothetical protein n=1 Tax=Methylobacterium sp. TaxID=409 RepID=UPI0025FCF8F3|nr:hypothetical protein [Methylobacterium sp.]MBX9934544.1 hypothetical protein [Methylobacterium sp.]